MKTARIFLSVVFFFMLVAMVFAMLFERVPPATLGVKQNLWGGGVVEEDYFTGYHLGITGFHKWHFLDRRTHFLTFANSHSEPTSMSRTMPALELRTKDNNIATYDVTVTYRIIPGQAHQIVKNGLKNRYKDLVIATVESVLREELAQLSSEDLTSTENRLTVAASTLPTLTEAMTQYFVEPSSILIRAVNFQEAYERKLQEKQLSYQKRLLAEAERRVEEQSAITETKAAEIEAAAKELRGDRNKELQEAASQTQVDIAGILAVAEIYDRRVRAEADADYERMVAEGRLAIEKSEALRNELRNQALDTVGGRIYMAEQAARNLRIGHVTLNSNDPAVPSILDVDAFLQLLIGSDQPAANR